MERNKIKDFYAQEIEANRLELEAFKLEGIRTKEIIERYIQKNNLEILDIGGGAGFYSFWLQEKGHNVTLVDLSPKNIELVKKHSETTGRNLKKFETGDAVNLHFSNEQFDLVLLLGPLYHLTDRAERIKALAEAMRVLKPKGVLLSAVISRYASLIDGFQRDLVLDDQFFNLLTNDLKTGVHLNETDNLEYFTTAYLHTPTEIITEIAESGLKFEKLIPIESFGWIVKNFNEKEKDPNYMKKLLEVIRMVEMNEDLLAISPHIIAVAQKE
ncbi:MAG: class I SAM-dependent methyltransferase [Chitinophagaceae bacterium]